MTIMDDIIYRGKVRPMNAADGTAQWIVLTEENNVIACWKETLICDDEAGYSPELLWWKRKWQRNDALEKAVLEADALRHDH